MTAQVIVTNTEKTDAIQAAIGGKMRNTFKTLEEAKAAFEKGKALAAAESLPCFAHADEAFSDGMVPAVAIVGARKRVAGGKMESGIKGVVMFPIPSTESFYELAQAWVAKIVEKEAAHVAFRRLRNAESSEELEQAAGAMPLDVASYVAEHARGGEGLDTDTFDTVWTPIRKHLKDAMPGLVALLPQKAEVLKAIRSEAYAKAEQGPLEAKGVFVYLANLIIQAAEAWTAGASQEAAPLDTSAIKGWLEERGTLDLRTEKDYSELDKLDLGF